MPEAPAAGSGTVSRAASWDGTAPENEVADDPVDPPGNKPAEEIGPGRPDVGCAGEGAAAPEDGPGTTDWF